MGQVKCFLHRLSTGLQRLKGSDLLDEWASAANEGGKVSSFIVRSAILPHAVEDSKPFAGKVAQGEGVGLTFAAGVVVKGARPGAACDREKGEEVQGVAEIPLTGMAHPNGLGVAAFHEERDRAAEHFQGMGGVEPPAVGAEVAEEARKQLEQCPAKELKGEEGEKLLKAFQEEAESAEAGMGAMFG